MKYTDKSNDSWMNKPAPWWFKWVIGFVLGVIGLAGFILEAKLMAWVAKTF